jgi:hypothetical protein
MQRLFEPLDVLDQVGALVPVEREARHHTPVGATLQQRFDVVCKLVGRGLVGWQFEIDVVIDCALPHKVVVVDA